jgi:hypothetical protein
MNQYEKDLQYVRKVMNSVQNQNQLKVAQNLKNNFIGKYCVLVSPTDPTFIALINELNELERTVTRRITSDYLF